MGKTWMRKGLACLLALSLCLTLLPTAARAAEGPEPGENAPVTARAGGNQGENDQDSAGGDSASDTGSSEDDGGGTDEAPAGDGSEDDPYQIGTAEDLLWFAGLVNGTLDGEEKKTTPGPS